MNRTNIIQFLISKHGFKSYLEIGCDLNQTFSLIVIDKKVGVDPVRGGTLRMTSDQFFAKNKEKFDIIFIDGLHHADQVYKDIKNALEILNDGGYIVCHDMNPSNELMQRIPRVTKQWTGDCWRAWLRLRTELKKDIQMNVFEGDFGVGIINKQEGYYNDIQIDWKMQFNVFQKNRKKLLNLISREQFFNIYGQ